MKCDDCVNLLAEYLDGEADERDAEMVRAHLITCAGCTQEFEAMTAEQEIYSRYDRELEIPPSLWNSIVARTAAESRNTDSGSPFSLRAWLAGLFAAPRYGLAGAVAVLIVGVVIGVMYLRTQPPPAVPDRLTGIGGPTRVQTPENLIAVVNPPVKIPAVKSGTGTEGVQMNVASRPNRPLQPVRSANQSDDVLFSDIAYSEIEDKDTTEHIAQAQNLLRSIRSIQLSNETEVDVTYEKAMSRRLLNENVVLRRDAETSGKFPAKTLLSDLEPFLIDIANLPDKTTPNDLRALKDRVQKTEIVAALQSY